MAARAERRYEDLNGAKRPEGSSRNVRYVVFEAATFDEAIAVLDRDSALNEGDLVRNSYDGVQRINGDTWDASVNYVPFVGGLPDPSAFPGGRTGSFQFETGGGKRKVLKNLVTYQVANPTGADTPLTAEQAGQLINANADGVEGVEIESSVFRFSVSKAFSPAELAPGYVARLYEATNCWNLTPVNVHVDGIVLNFAQGELIFLGASGGRGEDGLWKFTYAFAAMKNQDPLTIEGLDPMPNVFGWSYVEVKTERSTIGTPAVPIRKPILAIEHKVYEHYDLNTLGI